MGKNIYIQILLSLVLLPSFGQIRCIEKDYSDFEKSELSQLFTSYLNSNSKARIANQTYNVALKVNIVLGSSTNENFFTKEEVLEIVNNANVYFGNINVKFSLLDDKVNYIHDDENTNLKIENEQAFRANYDVTNAINIYFFKTITQKDLTLLNGFATLPNYSLASNRIMYSYLDKNPEDYKTLKEKVFLHELGHYFGLLHTFQDSNNADISKRELVTRGVGANCMTTGDQICDTNADPFERLPSIAAYDCSSLIDKTIVDANGDSFQPPTNNIMSYHLRCGNVFSFQQYQKMQASFAIRFSPSSQYQIGATASNFISISSLSKSSFCEGEQVVVNFKTEGVFEVTNQFLLFLSDANGENFKAVNAVFSDKKATFSVPNSVLASSNYRVIISSSKPAVSSPISSNFEIKTKGIVQLSTTQFRIRQGESTSISLSMNGSGPWNISLSNGLELNNFNSTSTNFTVKPAENTSIFVTSASGACGTINTNSGVSISVVKPSLQILDSFNSNLCKNAFVRVPVIGLNNFTTTNPYKIILTDIATNKRFELIPQVSIFSLLSLLPSNLTIEKNYTLHIEGLSFEEFSLPKTVTIHKKPEKPVTTSPLTYCFNSTSKPLTAVGNTLKWYYGENELTSYSQILPRTSQEGIYVYYVSQSNTYDCESERSRIEVKIKQPVTAEISGNEVINLGETAKIRIKMTGESPWSIELSNGEKFSSEIAINEQSVQPNKTSVYTLKSVNNQCGNGFVSGEAKITVLSPLEIEEEISNSFAIYPNPIINSFDIQVGNSSILENAHLHICTLDGREVFRSEYPLLQPNALLNIDGNKFPSGILMITLSDAKNKLVFKAIKTK